VESREISQAEYDKLTRGPKRPTSLMSEDPHKAMMDAITKRLTNRPIRYDVTYDGHGRIQSVTPIYKD